LPTAAILALRQAHSPDAPPARATASDDLTQRQKKVLKLLAEGMSNKHIARELQISEITVKAHVSLILKKLGVRNRVQAAMEARRMLTES
jgi:DNA-binding NarL/FixJ family response regulator